MKYRNVKIQYEQEEDEFSGGSIFRIDGSTYHALKGHYAELQEEDEDAIPRDVCDVIEHEDWSDHIQSSNTGAFISILSILTEVLQGEFEVTVTYEHPIWLFHDLSHVRFDSAEGQLDMIDGEAEAQAISDSIDICMENNIRIPTDLLSTTYNEYEERFGYPLLLDRMHTQFNPFELSNFTCKALE